MKTREEIIKKAQELLACGALSKEACDAIKADFPELAESEDERIRKEIIHYILYGTKETVSKDTKNTWIAYLEKQKFTHHQIDESLQDAVMHQMEDDGDVDDFVRKGIDDIALKYAELGARWQKEQKGSLRVIKDASEWEKIKEQKPAEWSEEDEEVYSLLDCILDDFKNAFKGSAASYKRVSADADKVYSWVHNRLSSLRPQPHWKPSEEQMCELNWASKLSPVLESLYNDLKKL